MNTTKLSSKHQIVVPKSVREAIKLKVGSRVMLYPIDEERAVLVKEPKSYVQALQGLGKEVWQSLGGGDKYIKEERASWNKRSA